VLSGNTGPFTINLVLECSVLAFDKTIKSHNMRRSGLWIIAAATVLVLVSAENIDHISSTEEAKAGTVTGADVPKDVDASLRHVSTPDAKSGDDVQKVLFSDEAKAKMHKR
jgi:hypothetical protein